MNGGASLAGNILQDALVGAVERFARRARRDDQIPDHLRLVKQRQAHRLVHHGTPRSAGLEGLVLSELNRSIWQLERYGDGFDNAGQRRFRRMSCLQTAVQISQHRERFVALAKQQPVGCALQAFAQGLDQHRDGAGREEGDQQVAARVKYRAEQANDEYVQPDDHHGE
jgi:hypothetical protein